jgi:hypothetical protein
MLGPEIYQPVVEHIRARLRSADTPHKQLPKRETPRYLRIIASPDDEQDIRLRAEFQGDVGTLRWDVVKECVGSMADIAKSHMVSVL